MVVAIEKAEYKGEYKIKLEFTDGISRLLDFKHFLTKSLNPMTSKYLDKAQFSKFKIEYGDLVWGDYEMCFPVWDLHEGRI